MIHPHHESSPHADDGHHWQQFLQPDVHHTHFGLRPTVRRINNRLKLHAFLQDVLRAFLLRNHCQVFFLRIEDHSHPGKREEWLEDVIFKIVRRLLHSIQEPGLGHALMLQIRQRKLAHTEKPVGMPRPLHLQVLIEPECEFQIFAYQFIHDDAIVDTMNRKTLARVFVK